MNNLYAICVTALLLCQAGHAASDTEYTVRAFVAKAISLELSEFTIIDIKKSDADEFATTIEHLHYLKDQSKAPLQTIFSDTTTPTAVIFYALLSARQAIDSMNNELARPWGALCERVLPTFDEEIKSIQHNNALFKGDAYLALTDDKNKILKNWLETFKQKQQSGEISISSADLYLEINKYFQDHIIELTKERAKVQDAFLQISRELNGNNSDKDALPSLVAYFSASK